MIYTTIFAVNAPRVMLTPFCTGDILVFDHLDCKTSGFGFPNAVVRLKLEDHEAALLEHPDPQVAVERISIQRV